jgi:hypothetical protein
MSFEKPAARTTGHTLKPHNFQCHNICGQANIWRGKIRGNFRAEMQKGELLIPTLSPLLSDTC